MAIIVKNRYMSIKTYNKTTGNTMLNKYNTGSLMTGGLFITGAIIVSNFNVQDYFTRHCVGLFIFLLSGALDIYMWCLIAYAMNDVSTGRFRAKLLVIYCIIATASPLLHVYSMTLFPEVSDSYTMRLLWNSSQPGYAVHVVSGALEYCICIILVVYANQFVHDYNYKSSEKLKV